MLLIARFLKTAFNINTNIEHLENLKNYVFSKGVSFVFLNNNDTTKQKKISNISPNLPRNTES